MIIKNIMEDIVSASVDELIEKTDRLKNLSDYRNNIIAYTLNRIQPRYVTSERGIIHSRLESRYIFQQKADILMLIHEAAELISSRRLSKTHDNITEIQARDIFFPHLMGEVLEETTFSIIPGVEITLFMNDNPADMIDDSWNNPYVTGMATNGYYHFWPDFNPDKMDTGATYTFSLKFTHPKCETRTTSVELTPVDDINFYKSKFVPLTLLTVKEGIDISFLYEQ